MSTVRFGSYRLVEKIGQGSAGTVFVGEYGSLRRLFAIKVLHEHLVADGSADRMLAEAQTLSLLDHPGIVKVVDCGMTDDGRAYIVMEYVIGELLHWRLRRGPLTEEQVVMFARQLASALHVAHAAGIIHRDVKPENAIVVADPDVPGGERIKLLDFGIAKCVDLDRTEAGVVLGTPAYMAPEQFSASRSVDHRVDIYALGVVMYAMATGTLPFVGNDTDELRAEHSYCRPRPASSSGVSDRMSEIIDRCLAKQPQDRFASMADLGSALCELDVDEVTNDAGGAYGGLIDAELAETDSALLVSLASTGVERTSIPTPAHPTRRIVALPTDLGIRKPMPWRTVVGVTVALGAALAYVQLEHRGAREAPVQPVRIVEPDATSSVERPAGEPRPDLARHGAAPAEQRDVTASRAPAALDERPEQSRRDSTRARHRPVRREPVRREPVRAEASPDRVRNVELGSERAEPDAQASTKEEEDYATVTPPTLY